MLWLPDRGDGLQESYVNLIPTGQGGTHVNGLRSGLLEAVREYCEFRSLLPRGIKLAPDDVWENISYVLSVKMTEPQFTGQTKERLSSPRSGSQSTAQCADSELPSKAATNGSEGRVSISPSDSLR